MKKAISLLLFSFLTKLSLGQAASNVGAWYWSDSTQQTSLFFEHGGNVSMHTGPKGGVILTKNLKNGTYVLTSEMLTITWADKSVEKHHIKFMDAHRFQLTVVEKNRKTVRTFRRVVDEEVVEKQ